MVTEQLGEQQCLESLRRPLDEEPQEHGTRRGTRKGPVGLEGVQWGEFLWGSRLLEALIPALARTSQGQVGAWAWNLCPSLSCH